jgi:nucleotide-binding universal stress UspA family protein
MYQTLLVPLDGSALAEQALPYAEALARSGDARIVLVRVAPGATLPAAALEAVGEAVRPVVRAVSAPTAACDAATDDSTEPVHQAEAYLNGVTVRLREEAILAEPVVAFGDPAAAIVEQVAAQRADLVVMATHGRSGLARAVMGSVALGVLRSGSAPVLLVRTGSQPPRELRTGQRPRLLLPLDGSGLAECVIPVAAELASQLDAELVLLQVVPDEVAGAVEHARQYLETVADVVAGKYLVERPRVQARTGRAEDTIAAVAGSADLVVMATHGRSGLARGVYGSVAEEVLRRGGTPALLVRPAALRDAPVSPAAATTVESGLDVGSPQG